MKYNGLSYSGSVQDMILSTVLERHKTVRKYIIPLILFSHIPPPFLSPLTSMDPKALEKSGNGSCYPLGSELA